MDGALISLISTLAPHTYSAIKNILEAKKANQQTQTILLAVINENIVKLREDNGLTRQQIAQEAQAIKDKIDHGVLVEQMNSKKLDALLERKR